MTRGRGISLYKASFAITALIAAFSCVTLIRTSGAANQTSSLDVVAEGVTVTSVVVNNGNPITLTANATTNVAVSFTITNGLGCGHVFTGGNVTSTLLRSGVGTGCSASTLNCYVVTTTTHNCAVSTTTNANATATFQVWYFAEATDASSSFAAQDWAAFIAVRNGSGTTATASSTGVELNTLLAINLTSSSIAYGTVVQSSNTSGTNQTVTTVNAGNASTTLQISGTAFTSGANSIATSSQHYATGTFTFGGVEQQLQSTAQTVSGFSIARPPLTKWAMTQALPSVVQFHGSVSNNGYLYVIGGTTNGGPESTSTVRFAKPNADGTISNWSSTTALPRALNSPAVAVYNNYLYVSGGVDTLDSATATVTFAPINATGSIGVWATTTPLLWNTFSHAMTALNGYMYIIGIGDPNTGNPSSAVHFAPINSTGSLGSWTTTRNMPEAKRYHGALSVGNHLYAIGGLEDILSTSTDKVFFARPGVTGSIPFWSTGQSLPRPLTSMGFAYNENILYVVGGRAAGGPLPTSSTLFSPLGSGGGSDQWGTTALLPIGLRRHQTVAVNGFLYNTGGNDDDGGVTSTVTYAPIQSRTTYWGVEVPGGTTGGDYTSTVTMTAVFSP